LVGIVPLFGVPLAVKAALVNASTLAHPDFNKPFLILTDASSKFLSAALIQLDDEENP
jgi:hypothetical protein